MLSFRYSLQPGNGFEHRKTRLILLREHTLHGSVTGLDKVQTLPSAQDGLDRLLISFKDAKVSQPCRAPDLEPIIMPLDRDARMVR